MRSKRRRRKGEKEYISKVVVYHGRHTYILKK